MEKRHDRIDLSRQRPLSLSIRLPDYDYTRPGAYSITVCAFERKLLFGNVTDRQMVLNESGKIVESCWREIKNHFSNIEQPAFVIMPNHIHGILVIDESVATRHAVSDSSKSSKSTVSSSESFGRPVKGSVPTIIRSFKSAVTKQVNLSREGKRITVWQAGYYEHVIRSETELIEITEYIVYNPMKWEIDRENPDVPITVKPLPFET
jgi:REP element-mobilizing transposase RayT